MIVTVHLFARARDLAGTDKIIVAVPDDPLVGDVRRQLVKMYPAMAGLVEHSALALNEDFADDGMAIGPGDELALLPPVSGGQEILPG